MAPTIWGLNLGDMKWGKFKSSYMFGNRDYHLRRTKFVVYQLALILTVVSESLGTSALSNYVDEQKRVESLDINAHNYNNDYVGVASFNIFAGVFTAFIFGAAFFFDLFWPARHEDRGIRIAWKACGVMSCVFVLASALAMTIIVALRSANVTGVSPERAEELLGQYAKYNVTPLTYKDNGRALASVIFIWPGWVATVASCVLLFLSIDNAETGPGPLSAHARDAEKAIATEQPAARDSVATDATYVPADAHNATNNPQHKPEEPTNMPREPTPAAS